MTTLTQNVPHNPLTGTIYQGSNTLILSRMNPCKEWATFLQWKAAGYRVRKGEHGAGIVKFVTIDTKEGEKSVPRHYTVFNRTQVEK